MSWENSKQLQVFTVREFPEKNLILSYIYSCFEGFSLNILFSPNFSRLVVHLIFERLQTELTNISSFTYSFIHTYVYMYIHINVCMYVYYTTRQTSLQTKFSLRMLTMMFVFINDDTNIFKLNSSLNNTSSLKVLNLTYTAIQTNNQLKFYRKVPTNNYEDVIMNV